MIGIATVVRRPEEGKMPKQDITKVLRKGPDLDQYLEGKKKKYTTYGLGASLYSLNYYTFVKLVKEAGANMQIKKKVVVDLDVLDAYLDGLCEGGRICLSWH